MKKWIELLVAVGDKEAGTFHQEEEATCRAYIDAGLAKDAGDGPDHILLERAVSRFGDKLQGVISEVTTTLDAATERLARPRIDAGEAEADKTQSIGDWARCIIAAGDPRDPEGQANAHKRLTECYGSKFRRGMTEGQGTSVGYDTPVVYESMISKIMWEQEVIRNRATQVPLAARDVEWPAIDQYITPAANSSAQHGGVVTYYKSEAAQRTLSTLKLRKVKMTANDLTAYTEISRDAAQDVQTLDAQIPLIFGEAIGWREDFEFLNGDGVGRPLGIYNAPALLVTGGNAGKTARQTANVVTYRDLTVMYSRLLPSERAVAIWIGHPYMTDLLLNVVDGTGRPVLLPYVGETPPIGPAPAYTMWGRPFYDTEKAPAIGSQSDLCLVSPRLYYAGTRSGMEIGLSEHFKFDTDQIAFRVKLRHDGRPRQISQITLADGTSKVSGFISLGHT